MMPQCACVDASLAVALVNPNKQPQAVLALWQNWTDVGADLFAPPLYFAEGTSVLRNKVFRGELTEEEGEAAFQLFLTLGVRSVDLPDLQTRAWELAKRYNRPRACDAQYLAVAMALGCDLWTADERLANAVQESWVRLVR